MKLFAGVLLIQNNKYVLQHRDDKPGISMPGELCTWGGEIEEDETPRQAALRELLEETGVNLKEDDLYDLSIKVYKDTQDDVVLKGEHTKVYTYYAEISQDAKVTCNEGQGLAYVDVGSGDFTNMSRGTKRVVELYEAKIR